MNDELGDTSLAVSIKDVFISKGCERRTHVLDWSRRLDTVVYGSAGDLCIAEIGECSRVLQTKQTHVHPLTYLKFSRWSHSCTKKPIDFLVSGDSGGLFAIHKLTVDENVYRIHCIATYQSDALAVTCCAGMVLGTENSAFSIATAYSLPNGTVKVYFGSVLGETYGEEKCVELSVGYAIALCMDFAVFSDMLLLGVGTSDCTIEVFCEKENTKGLNKLLTLRGHSNWITDLSFKDSKEEGCDWLWLASSGQDNVIRLWRFTLVGTGQKHRDKVSFLADIGEGRVLLAELEALLSGHEDWIVSVQWHPNEDQILSASADKSLIIWEASEGGQGAWLEKVLVGEVGGQASGYHGGSFSPDGCIILAHSYFGGFHAWRLDKDQSDVWKPLAIFSGHSLGVCDLSWDPSGTYLVSCSLDQTARCFAPCLTGVHAEIARPQVHGHDFSCIASISTTMYVSGAEEKILRVFQSPRFFAETLTNISGYSFQKIFPDEACLAQQGASLPALGLSNKQMDNTGAVPFIEDSEENKDIFIAPSVLTANPTEECLMQSTLWPEVQKLYGHGFEVFTVASNHAGTLIASTCKGSHIEHATILLWDTKTWKQKLSLSAHQLTVTQLAFSHSDEMLASVSRDRTFSIFLRSGKDDNEWSLLYKSKGRGDVHSRIIWACAWSNDDNYLATVSRDKKLALWTVDKQARVVSLAVETTFEHSVTAVDFCPSRIKSRYVIAIGLECGIIEILGWSGNKDDGLQKLLLMDQSVAHSQTVRRLMFRPCGGPWSSLLSSDDNMYELASAGLDNAVKVHRLEFGGL